MQGFVQSAALCRWELSSLVLSLFLTVGSEFLNQSKRDSPYVPLLSPSAFFPALTLLIVYSNTPPPSHTACTEMLDGLHVEEDYFIWGNRVSELVIETVRNAVKAWYCSGGIDCGGRLKTSALGHYKWVMKDDSMLPCLNIAHEYHSNLSSLFLSVSCSFLLALTAAAPQLSTISLSATFSFA